MTELEFTAQMNRMCETYGKTHYGTERVKIIWSAVKDMTGPWFEAICTELIGTLRQAPLVEDFAKKVAEERERVWRKKRDEHTQDSKDFWAGTYHTDEVKMISEAIRKRVKGQMSDEEWESFQRLLNTKKVRSV